MDSIFHALAHAIRREILVILAGGSRSAGELAEVFPVSKPTMSGHFSKLKAAGLIVAEQRAASVIYGLNVALLEEALLGFVSRVRQPGPDNRMRKS